MMPWLRLRHKLPTASLRGVVADLSTEDGVAALIAAVPTADVLVNNLGIFTIKISLAFRMMSGCTSITSTSSPAFVWRVTMRQA
ncbi:putative 3-oxoacyl-[acyl-carrier-protein] reductase [Escherichia coli]|uniref:Putative 3-oxoacyl-[acyl-carrier-protein] reductase n=1 Tax=Escherichia coli TaxID=562 RepID=A0A376MRJ9_ECOLX|nr:putative 3-oxoacyl-[acyl-carrier-protein] reductase [Escherichia coli]